MLTTPRSRGLGKRRSDRGGGIAKRPRMESSSSERRDKSEESRSGGTRDRPGRGGRRAAGPSTPPHRAPPPSISPRRSIRLTMCAVWDLQSLPLAAKSDRKTAHSRSVRGDEHRRGPSCSSQSSSDHGRSSQGRRSRSREPTPPQLMNFSIDDFTLVSHTMDSFTFTSAHPFFPGWVRVVGAHREDRVRNTPCAHNPAEEQRARRRVRRDVEPPEVRRFLQQELLKKGWALLVEQATGLPPRPGRRTGADAIAPVCSGCTLRSGAARSVAGPTGVGPRRVQRSDDTGWASRVPGHVITPHPGPRHRSRRRYGGVPKDKGGTSGNGDARTGDGPA